MVARNRLRSLCLSGTLLIALAGCAVRPRPLPPPPSEQTRATLGIVGVVSGGVSPKTELEPPTRGKDSGAGKGAAAGAVGSLLGGAQTGHPLGFAVGIALAPVFALSGANYGAVEAESAARV